MTVRINKPALNLRAEIASLRNQKSTEEYKIRLNGLVENGDFYSGTIGWSAGNDGSISSSLGVLTLVNGGSGRSRFGQPLKTVKGRKYRISYQIVSATSGSSIRFVTTSSSSITAETVVNSTGTTAGTYSLLWTATVDNNYIGIINNSVNASTLVTVVDNIYIYEVDSADNIIQYLPYGYEVQDVYIDGSLAREGSAYDYTVETDGIDKWLKLTVEPTASTETIVIGVRK